MMVSGQDTENNSTNGRAKVRSAKWLRPSSVLWLVVVLLTPWTLMGLVESNVSTGPEMELVLEDGKAEVSCTRCRQSRRQTPKDALSHENPGIVTIQKKVASRRPFPISNGSGHLLFNGLRAPMRC